MSGLHLALGIGLRRLQTWARWTDVVLIALVLAVYGIVAIVGIVTQGDRAAADRHLLRVRRSSGISSTCSLSSKATTIFSAEYKTIIAQTPHIQYRTSLVLKIFLVLHRRDRRARRRRRHHRREPR